MNIDEKIEIGKKIPESILSKFSKYKPLQVSYKGKVINYLYYSDSQMFNEIQEMINNMIHSFIVEVAQNSVSVPVIITNSDTTTILADGNLSEKDLKKIKRESVQTYVQEEMSENEPIQILLDKEKVGYLFYKDSVLISNLMYYPLLLIVITILLAMIVYFTFHSFEKYEKNQLWVGMSKETAHQLGTPISSLMAWTEILKMKELDPNIISELDKDVHRLETIAERFSKVGSIPNLTREDVVQTTLNAINYMKNRTAKTVISNVIAPEEPLYANLNTSLFAWVIENLWKNAIDAMQGKGILTIEISQENDLVCIDISDTGKGIPRNKFKTIFQPGYTTKSRGWGLGLSLAQRIVKEYHHGKIVVKSSEIDKGTTFRISLPLVR
jgi:signal transduction histidine kinase